MIRNDKKTNKQKGFTLLELIVAAGLFSILMVISVGAVFSVIDSSSKSQSLQAIINNLDFAIEGMARSMRIGRNYHCDNYGPIGVAQDCPAGASYISFEAAEGNDTSDADQVIYLYDADAKQILKSDNGGATFLPITAPEVVIENVSFYVVGAAAGDATQPKVIISISGYAGVKEKVQSQFTIQTSVSQRTLDS